MLLEEEIAQHNKIKHDLQYLSTLDLTNTESFAEAIKTMTEILLLFPQTFFALNLEKVSLKLMGDFFDQQNDANFDEFWTSHLEVLNSVCALTNYLDLNHAIYNAFDAHEQALSHGFFNFFFVTVAFPKFKRFIKQHWDHRHSNLLVHLLSSLSRPEMNRCSAKLAKHLFSNSILSFLTKHLIPSIESKDRLLDIHTHLLPWRNFTDKLKHKEYSTRVISSALKAKTSELWIKRELDIPELRALIDRSILLLEELDRDLLLITMLLPRLKYQINRAIELGKDLSSYQLGTLNWLFGVLPSDLIDWEIDQILDCLLKKRGEQKTNLSEQIKTTLREMQKYLPLSKIIQDIVQIN